MPLVLIPLITVLVNDAIKCIIQSIKHKKFDIRWMFHSGWAPSWHSSLASSVITTTLLHNGSTKWVDFMLATIFWIIIMYDARGIRAEASKHAKMLNKMQNNQIFDEYLWHTTFEVVCWALFWILLSALSSCQLEPLIQMKLYFT